MITVENIKDAMVRTTARGGADHVENGLQDTLLNFFMAAEFDKRFSHMKPAEAFALFSLGFCTGHECASETASNLFVEEIEKEERNKND